MSSPFQKLEVQDQVPVGLASSEPLSSACRWQPHGLLSEHLPCVHVYFQHFPLCPRACYLSLNQYQPRWVRATHLNHLFKGPISILRFQGLGLQHMNLRISQFSPQKPPRLNFCILRHFTMILHGLLTVSFQERGGLRCRHQPSSQYKGLFTSHLCQTKYADF